MRKFFLYVLLLPAFPTICQVMEVAVEKTQNVPEEKTFSRGETRKGLRHGLWMEYRDGTRYQPAKVDTFFVSRGRYVDGKKEGKWEYYGEPIKNKRDDYRAFYPRPESVVVYKNGRYIKKYELDYLGKVEQMIERSDSMIKKTTFRGEVFLMYANFRDDTLMNYVSERYLKKNLLVETYYRETGIVLKELFTNDHYYQELSKDYTQNTFNLSRNSYETTYTELLSQKNGKPIMERDYVNARLFNVVHYDANGARLDVGNFKDGNGLLYTRKLQNVNGAWSYAPLINAVNIYKYGLLTEVYWKFDGPVSSWKKGDAAYYMIRLTYYPNEKVFLREYSEAGLLREVDYYTKDSVRFDIGTFKDGNGWLKRYKLGQIQPYQEEYYEGGLLKQTRKIN